MHETFVTTRIPTVMISAKDFVISWGWGQCQGGVHGKGVFLSYFFFNVIYDLYGYRKICVLWNSMCGGLSFNCSLCCHDFFVARHLMHMPSA